MPAANCFDPRLVSRCWIDYNSTPLMTVDELNGLFTGALDERERNHLRRELATVRPIDAVHVEFGGETYTNFCSNNYLGLTHHPAVISAISAGARLAGAGSGAAALIAGHTSIHASAETALARWKGTESALLLPSGYQANHAAVQALASIARRAGGGVRFLIDKLSHASLIDAVRSTGEPMRVFPHNGLTKLARLLEEAEPTTANVVVTESIFSMDGDAADLVGLADLKRRRPFLLLLDEAHASGVYGADGAGLAAECGLQSAVDLTVLTLSKALGCMGGAICASSRICDAVVNFGRAYVYSTAVAPPIAAAAEAAVGVLQSEPHRQRRVRELAIRLRTRLAGAGVALPPGDSPIVPIVLGSEDAALHAADQLRQSKLLVMAVRPPTVPKGTSRLRVTLSSQHSDQEVLALTEMLSQVLHQIKPFA